MHEGFIVRPLKNELVRPRDEPARSMENAGLVLTHCFMMPIVC